MDFIEFLQKEFLGQLKNTKIIRRRESDDSNNLGELLGVDLDASKYRGYIYFWGQGLLDYAVYNMQEDKEEIPTTIIETKSYLSQLDIIRLIMNFYSQQGNGN